MDTLWTDFINSDWHDFRESGKYEDRLVLSSWQKQFLHDWQLKSSVPATDIELKALQTLRKLLHNYTLAIVKGSSADMIDWNELNRIMAQSPVIRQWNKDDEENRHVTYIPLVQDWNSVMAEVVSDFVHTVLDQDIQRIRICDNPDCRWVFYDDTRSRTKRYCEDKTCGNLMKVRRFRAKKGSSRSQ